MSYNCLHECIEFQAELLAFLLHDIIYFIYAFALQTRTLYYKTPHYKQLLLKRKQMMIAIGMNALEESYT